VGALETIGRLLFRLRSFTPLPVIMLGLALTWRKQAGPGLFGAEVDAALNVAGVVLCVLGTLIRVATVGFAPRSSTQTKTVSTTELHVDGVYALVRHPLYLGNAFITLGLLAIVDQPEAFSVVGTFFVVAYALIIHAEEVALKARFTDRFEAYRQRVPALLPTRLFLTGFRTLRFDLKTALHREITPFVAWGIGAQVLLGWEWWAKGALHDDLARRLRFGIIALLVLLIANKLWKRVGRASTAPSLPKARPDP
jgi:protein-S-isoprenylcysteine O-methyltransferase Ste14